MTGPVLRRQAGRVILLDGRDRVLLLQGTDVTLQPRPRWWFTPGGGCEPGEDHRAAAVRETFEELGVRLDDIHGPVHERHTRFRFEQTPVDQHELYFAARLRGPFRLDDRNWSDAERRSVTDHRWWSLADLRDSDETVYPEELIDVVTGVLAGPALPSA